MGLFRRQRRGGDEQRFTMQQLGGFYGVTGMGAGTVVTSPDEALRMSAVWACVDVLSTSGSQLPIGSVRKTSDGYQEPVEPLPPLLAQPSALVGPDVWLYQIMYALCTDGNNFGRIADVDRGGRPTQIELLDPGTVKQRQVHNGRARVKVGQASDWEYLWPHGPIWHVPGKMISPGTPFGLSPLVYAGKATGTGLAAEQYGATYFETGHPSALITADEELDASQAADIKSAYKRAVGSEREPAVFGSGLKYEALQAKPVDTQYLDLMRFTVEQVCRYYRVPPTMVYGVQTGQNITYVNASQADLGYLKHSLEGYLARIESALTAVLPRGQEAHFDRDAFLRSDTKSRFDTYAVGLEHDILSHAEVRAMENRAPIPEDERPSNELGGGGAAQPEAGSPLPFGAEGNEP